MRLHIGEKIREQKAMLISGKKYRPLIEDRVQRMAVYLMIGFFTFMLVCTIISRVSYSFTTAHVSVASMAGKTLMNRAELEGIIYASSEKGISLPDGLKAVSVNAGKGKSVEKGEALIEFDVPAAEERIKKLEEEIRILNLKLDISSNNGGNDVIEAQRTLEDAQKAYERIAAKYARAEMRLKEDYTKLEETLADAEKNLINKAEALVKEARENLQNVREDAEDAIRAAEQALDEESENLDDSEDSYQQALEAYEQAKDELNMANQRVSEIKEAIAGKQPDDATDYTEELKEAEEELSIAQKAFNQAKKELSKADYNSSSYDRADDNLDSIKRGWKRKIDKAKDALYKAETVLEAVREGKDFSTESAVSEAQAAIDTAREALNRARRESEDNQYSEEEELYAAGRAVETAQAALEDARRQAEVLQKEGEIDRITCESERSDKEKSRAALQEILDNGGRLLAPAPGTVVRTLERGDKTKEGEDAVILSSADRGFVFEGKLDKDSARRFSAGDKGELHYKLDGSTQKADVEIHSISTPDESDQVLVTAVLPEGDYTSGMPTQLFLSRKSETYQNCLPLTALRSDSGGDHVFVLRRQSSVLGTEWVIARVDITVKERDSQMMYVDGALTYSDQVVISSNKIISEGDRVRIEN
jgi:exonuclease VII small subunit